MQTCSLHLQGNQECSQQCRFHPAFSAQPVKHKAPDQDHTIQEVQQQGWKEKTDFR